MSHPLLDLTLRDRSGLTPFAAAMTFKNNKAAQAILDREPRAAEQVWEINTKIYLYLGRLSKRLRCSPAESRRSVGHTPRCQGGRKVRGQDNHVRSSVTEIMSDCCHCWFINRTMNKHEYRQIPSGHPLLINMWPSMTKPTKTSQKIKNELLLSYERATV